MEAGISDTYLEELNALYEEWIAGFDRAPVLVVPRIAWTSSRIPETLTTIITTVQGRLEGKQGLLFPEEGALFLMSAEIIAAARELARSADGFVSKSRSATSTIRWCMPASPMRNTSKDTQPPASAWSSLE